MPAAPSTWLSFSSNWLCFARETPDAFPDPNGGGNRRFRLPKTGIWMIPLDRLDREIASQKQAQQAEQDQAEVLAKATAQSLLQKYDRNHNGVIDPDEREAALDDPAFIQAELEAIDTNHNGWLDAPELVWFDANQNKILDAKEQAGISLAVQFLAQRLLDQFDHSGSGWLGMREYHGMIDSTLHDNANSEFSLQFVHADANHDNHLDFEELENLLRRHMEKELNPRGMRQLAPFGPMGMPGQRSAGFGQDWKAEVESYWRNSGNVSNRPPFNNQMPDGARFVPNQTQSSPSP
jgi:Ca2+-binding EF-hand superfamily protein